MGLRRCALAALAAAILALPGCRTSEANYRSAYERAIGHRDSVAALDSTIYGANRRAMDQRSVTVDGRTYSVRTQLVSITEGADGNAEALRRYNVVVGRFKQLFNARSLRNRVAASGYGDAMVVQTAEPYYYVVASSHDSLPLAQAALESFPELEFSLRPPLPFILEVPGRNR